MKNYFLFLFFMAYNFILAMDLDTKDLSQFLKLSERAIIQQDDKRVLIADIQHRYNKNKNSISYYLFLAHAPIDAHQMMFNKCKFCFPSKKILPCYGTLYSLTKNDIFYQIAVELPNQTYEDNFRLVKKDVSYGLNSEKYIIECGFSSLFTDFSRHGYLLFLDLDIDNTHSCTNMMDFITFPLLLKALLAASKTGSLKQYPGATIKIIHWKDVILPQNYQNFRAHPWNVFKDLKSFDNFGTASFRKICEEKYMAQHKEK